MTATMKKPKAKSKQKAAKGAKPQQAEAGTTQLKLFADEQLKRIEEWHREALTRPVRVEQITPSAFNPRTEFDHAELVELAKSYGAQGIIEPLVVRPLISFGAAAAEGRPHFELVAGERRWRAAQLAGLTTVPCLVRELTDHEAGLLQIVENFSRRDLNPVEEARGFARACQAETEGGLGYTQAALAEMIGCSPSHVSERIKLLTLPEAWLKPVRECFLPPRYALKLAPYAPHEELHKPLAEFCRHGEGGWAFEGESNFIESAWRKVLQHTGEMEGSSWTGCDYVKWKMKPTDEQREKLKVFECFSPYKDHNGELRALNVKFAKQLQEQAIAAAKSKKTAKSDAKAERGGKGKQASTAADVAKRAKKQAEQFARSAETLRVDWLRWQIAEKLQLSGHGGPTRWLVDKIILWVATAGEALQGMYRQDRDHDLSEAVLAAGGQDRVEAWDSLASVAVIDRQDAVLINLASRWLCKDRETGEPSAMLPAWLVEAIAEELGLDVGRAWGVQKCGPLTGRWFNLHSKDQLVKLAKALDLPLILTEGSGAKKSQLVKALVDAPPGPLPAELGGKKPATKKAKGRK